MAGGDFWANLGWIVAVKMTNWKPTHINRHTHTHTDKHTTAHSHNKLYGSLRDCLRNYKSKIQISLKSCFHLMNNLFESIFDENYLKVAMKWNMVINLDMWCCPNIERKIWKPFVAKKGFQRLLICPPYWASALSLSLDCLYSSPYLNHRLD